MIGPENRTVVQVDVAGFAGRPNPAQQHIREVLPSQLATAFGNAGIDWLRCHYGDRGDGGLIVLPSGGSPLPVLQAAVPGLARAIAEHNAAHGTDPAWQFVLRVAVNEGTVHVDPGGFTGSTINDTARIVDAKPLRRVLRRTGAPLGVAVSTTVYDNYVRHGYGAIEQTEYVKSRVAVKEFKSRVWIHVPDVDTRKVRRAAPMLSIAGIAVTGTAGLAALAGLALLYGSASDVLNVNLPNGNGWASVDADLRALTVCDTRPNARGVRLEFTVEGSDVVHRIGDGNGSPSPCGTTRTGYPVTAIRVCESRAADAPEDETGGEVCSEWVRY